MGTSSPSRSRRSERPQPFQGGLAPLELIALSQEIQRRLEGEDQLAQPTANVGSVHNDCNAGGGLSAAPLSFLGLGGPVAPTWQHVGEIGDIVGSAVLPSGARALIGRGALSLVAGVAGAAGAVPSAVSAAVGSNTGSTVLVDLTGDSPDFIFAMESASLSGSGSLSGDSPGSGLPQVVATSLPTPIGGPAIEGGGHFRRFHFGQLGSPQSGGMILTSTSERAEDWTAAQDGNVLQARSRDLPSCLKYPRKSSPSHEKK